MDKSGLKLLAPFLVRFRVRRHVDFVYSAALRMVRDAHQAEDVTQAVFVTLAQNTRQLSDRPVLSGWLHRTARNLSSNIIRSESRRRTREQEAAAMNELISATADASWEQIMPELDAALGELSESDRDAILLRYFERKSAQEMAAILGLNAEAAQKRVNRAVERLRDYFSKRKIAIGTSGLAVVISANAVQSAPVGLAATISTAAVLAGTAVHTSQIIAATKIIAMTTLQKTFITAAIVVIAGAGIYEARQTAQLKDQIQTARQQQALLAEQNQQLLREQMDATNRLASLYEELAKTKSDNLELLRLRNEITALRHGQPAVSSTSSASTTNDVSSPENRGQELGRAVVRGDAGAFDKLLAEAKAEHQSFSTNEIGLTDQQRGDLAHQTFTPIGAAFKIIGDAAAQGSQPALDALTRSMQIPLLSGMAVSSLGSLAANGDPGALDVLLHPGKYDASLPATISALQPAADNGNQKAIEGLSAIAQNQANQPLWFLAAESLAKAAANGNAVAIDALVIMSASTNQNVQSPVVRSLRGAAANQNPKALQALRTMGVQ